jgi:hypothetical protein
MPRNKNAIETVTITISTTPPVQQYLGRLVKSGLYGKNVAEAAERLITTQIQILFADEALPQRRARA